MIHIKDVVLFKLRKVCLIMNEKGYCSESSKFVLSWPCYF